MRWQHTFLWRNISEDVGCDFSGPLAAFFFKSAMKQRKKPHGMGPNLKAQGENCFFILPLGGSPWPDHHTYIYLNVVTAHKQLHILPLIISETQTAKNLSGAKAL